MFMKCERQLLVWDAFPSLAHRGLIVIMMTNGIWTSYLTGTAAKYGGSLVGKEKLPAFEFICRKVGTECPQNFCTEPISVEVRR